ncbi:MAG TPA: ATP-binding protein [Bryobacteraceae bacterium]|jgi:two-component system heavy metal sensor histidine kinase CusS|nr:ATP-binding protein [Bryobacteraceae bacterium]
MRARSIRFRLTVWYAAVLAGALALFAALLWIGLRQRLMRDLDQDLAGRADRFERYFTAESAEFSGSTLKDELQEFCQALPPESYLRLRSDRGFTFNYPDRQPLAATQFRVIDRDFTINGEHYHLMAGEPLETVLHTLDLLRWLLLSLIPAVIGIASFGGAWLSRRALKPVDEIAAAAHAISIENLSGRLPVPATGDEIARLSRVLNQMLDRLESAVRTLSQFVADASHELRTPLAVIRTTAELALRRAREPEVYRGALREIGAETERLTRLVEDLLALARSDTGTVEMPLSPVDVRGVIQAVCGEMAGLAELRGIRISALVSDDPLTISANPAALHRLLMLLLDNAVKYSRDGGEVRVRAGCDDSRVMVEVEDSGVGIDAADMPHIFKRFYRADRARGGGGYGLGLSLAESIAKAHGAEIEVRSRVGEGSVFRVKFPARSNLLREMLTSRAGEHCELGAIRRVESAE